MSGPEGAGDGIHLKLGVDVAGFGIDIFEAGVVPYLSWHKGEPNSPLAVWQAKKQPPKDKNRALAKGKRHLAPGLTRLSRGLAIVAASLSVLA